MLCNEAYKLLIVIKDFNNNTIWTSILFRHCYIIIWKLFLCLSVVTLYATLGEDAIIHGVNESEVTHVITSADLLPKFQVYTSCIGNSPCWVEKYFFRDLVVFKPIEHAVTTSRCYSYSICQSLFTAYLQNHWHIDFILGS